MRRLTLLALIFMFAGLARAAIDPYDFDSDAQRERYRHFIEDMRCPKCQNQNLAGSDAPIAKDLRHELHRLLVEGRSDKEIVDFMVSRYGEFVLYKPPFDKRTAILWLAPPAFLAIGAAVLIVVIRRRAVNAGADALNAAEQQQLAALLGESQPGEKRP